MTAPRTPGTSRKRLTAKRLFVTALALAAGVGGWLASGPNTATETSRAATPPDAEAAGLVVADPAGEEHAPPHTDLARTATVWVEVVSVDGAPVVGAAVKLRAPMGTHEQRSDEEGIGTFEALWPGLYAVEVTATGFTPWTGYEELRPGLAEAAWTFRLQPDANAPAALRGVVRSAGVPVAGALVAFLREGSALSDSAALSSDDGRFALPAAAEADALVAFHEKYGVVQRALADDGEVVLELPAPGFVEGRVTDQRGRPLLAFQIQAAVTDLPPGLERALSVASGFDGRRSRAVTRRLQTPWRSFPDADKEASDGAAATTMAKAPGSFRVGPVPAGHVRVVASADGRAPAERIVAVKPGDVSRDVQLQLAGPLVVTGCVRDANSAKPIPSARLRALRAPGPAAPGFATASTDKDGCYRMLTQAGVRHSISVQARGYIAESVGGLIGRSDDEVRRDFHLQPSKGAHRAGYRYVGIGAKLSTHDDGAQVVGVFQSGSAAGALEEGDIVLRVDGVWTEGLPLGRIVEMIVGEDGTEVELLVQPKGGGPVETVVLARQPTSSRG